MDEKRKKQKSNRINYSWEKRHRNASVVDTSLACKITNILHSTYKPMSLCDVTVAPANDNAFLWLADMHTVRRKNRRHGQCNESIKSLSTLKIEIHAVGSAERQRRMRYKVSLQQKATLASTARYHELWAPNFLHFCANKLLRLHSCFVDDFRRCFMSVIPLFLRFYANMLLI